LKEDHHEHIESTHPDDFSPGNEVDEKVWMVWHSLFPDQSNIVAYRPFHHLYSQLKLITFSDLLFNSSPELNPIQRESITGYPLKQKTHGDGLHPRKFRRTNVSRTAGL
jgi:hypothetical protein